MQVKYYNDRNSSQGLLNEESRCLPNDSDMSVTVFNSATDSDDEAASSKKCKRKGLLIAGTVGILAIAACGYFVLSGSFGPLELQNETDTAEQIIYESDLPEELPEDTYEDEPSLDFDITPEVVPMPDGPETVIDHELVDKELAIDEAVDEVIEVAENDVTEEVSGEVVEEIQEEPENPDIQEVSKAEDTEIEEDISVEEVVIDDPQEETEEQITEAEEPVEDKELKKYAVITSVALAVRDKADLEAGTVGYLNNGDKLECIDDISMKHWVKVLYKGKEAYLDRYYIKVIEE